MSMSKKRNAQKTGMLKNEHVEKTDMPKNSHMSMPKKQACKKTGMLKIRYAKEQVCQRLFFCPDEQGELSNAGRGTTPRRAVPSQAA